MHMKHFDITSLEGAMAAARDGTLEEWLHAFLVEGPNSNPGLSDGLKSLPSRTYAEPVLFSLAKLTRVCGPEENMEYTVDKDGWEKKVGTLVEKIRGGWNPQPLLSAGSGNEALTIRDGSHRYEALVRAGVKEYWVIFFYDSHEKMQLHTPQKRV